MHSTSMYTRILHCALSNKRTRQQQDNNKTTTRQQQDNKTTRQQDTKTTTRTDKKKKNKHIEEMDQSRWFWKKRRVGGWCKMTWEAKMFLGRRGTISQWAARYNGKKKLKYGKWYCFGGESVRVRVRDRVRVTTLPFGYQCPCQTLLGLLLPLH